MFFRREKVHKSNFQERLSKLRELQFRVEELGPGKVRVSKLGAAAMLEDSGGETPNVGKAGILLSNDIGYLVHGGYQAFFETATRHKVPALAEHLRALHDFVEDLREGLGLTSLYNTSLGTTFNRHVYDRVARRDVEEPKKPWQARLREGEE